MALAWLAVALVLILLEVATLAFFSVFLAVGALAGALLAYLGFTLWVQVLAFALVSALGVLLGRPPLVRALRRGRSRLRSGATEMIGKQAVLVGAIPGPGRVGHVRISGEDWPARSVSGEPIGDGVTVEVKSIEGATLVVEPLVSGEED